MSRKMKSENPLNKWRDPEWVHRVVELAKVYPEWGCDRIAYFFALKGQSISAPTVQRILNSQGLGTASIRLQRAEAKSQNQ